MRILGAGQKEMLAFPVITIFVAAMVLFSAPGKTL